MHYSGNSLSKASINKVKLILKINDNSGYLTGGINNENEIDKLFGDID